MGAPSSPRAQRHFPAYGREIADLRRRGLVPVGTVVVAVDLWHLGRSYPRVVVPAELEPDGVDFTMLAGLELFLAWHSRTTQMSRLNAMVDALVAVRPAFLWVCPVDEPQRAFVAVSRRLGIAWPREGS